MVLCVSSVESSLSLSCGAVGDVASCSCWLSSEIGSGGRDDEDAYEERETMVYHTNLSDLSSTI